MSLCPFYKVVMRLLDTATGITCRPIALWVFGPYNIFPPSIIDPLSYNEAAAACINDHNGILAPLNETSEITSALCSALPTEFRIQGIAREECWVDHEDESIDSSLLSSPAPSGRYETIYLDTENNIIRENDETVEMAALCQFPKGAGICPALDV